MKRVLPFLLCVLFLVACKPQQSSNVYQHSLFTVSLPEPFEPVQTDSLICFAPYGDPLLSSSITYYTTELNPYFDDFSEAEYAQALKELCGYESLTLETIETYRIDGYEAKRISCKVLIDQGTHDLILYAISGDRIFFFTLLNREGDPYIDAFDQMMKTLRFVKS